MEHAVGDALEARYNEVWERIGEAASRGGESAGRVILVAVTKFAEPEQIRDLIQLGHKDFGENKAQQLLQRAAMADEMLARRRVLPRTVERQSTGFELLPSGGGRAVPDAVRWHMIGHVQRNKARKVVDVCRLIHSVDTLRLAEELQTIGLKQEREVEALLQINCSGESQKHGCPPAAALHLAEQIDSMVYVRLRGVMTMAPQTDDPDRDARPVFAHCREVFEEIRREGIGAGRFNILSMGMSGDFEAAIEEGANVVRVGSAIFGAPPE